MPQSTEQKARIYKLLGNPSRLKIIELTSTGEFTIGEIASRLKISFTKASQYVSEMETLGLVSKRKGKDHFVHVASNIRIGHQGEITYK